MFVKKSATVYNSEPMEELKDRVNKVLGKLNIDKKRQKAIDLAGRVVEQ